MAELKLTLVAADLPEVKRHIEQLEKENRRLRGELDRKHRIIAAALELGLIDLAYENETEALADLEKKAYGGSLDTTPIHLRERVRLRREKAEADGGES